MQVFNDEHKCKKCGSKDKHIEYHRSCFGEILRYGVENSSEREHLHIKCERCGYDWIEETLDSEYAKELIVKQLIFQNESQEDFIKDIKNEKGAHKIKCNFNYLFCGFLF